MKWELTEVAHFLMQARQIMSVGRPRDDAEEWLLLATIIGDADLAFQEARRCNPTHTFPLLEAAVEELYEMTAGFTDPAFPRMTKAARRRHRALFG